ncbi:MAG: class I SAM-dependent methyltransferase [Betaproteobacteria bacterium]|nr:class I SAM-dependent methyltransferase [Betaproteobacteria bacterium]
MPENVSPAKILDVGCGGGQWLKAMVEYFSGSYGVGLEPSSEGIKLLKSKYRDSLSANFAQGLAH